VLELTPSNTVDYLQARGIHALRVTELVDGVSNAVLQVETPDGKFVLKQSRPQLRTKDPWFSNLSRIWRERDSMLLLGPLLPTGAVPKVYFSDEANYAFAMSHAPEPFRNWRTVLLSSEVDVSLGERAGRLLGAIHEQSARRVTDLGRFVDRTVFEQLRVDPFYVRIRERLPDVATQIEPLIGRCRTASLGLCHGDFSPKNLLLHADGFTLVDYETCHLGDVTFDLGFFLSHLLLKSVHRPESREAIFELTWAFWRGYATAATSFPRQELTTWGIAHLGGCLLARVDGTSPAPYLTIEAQRDAVRVLARRILRDRPTEWEHVLELAR
jgi:5-methylthioribose kinase